MFYLLSKNMNLSVENSSKYFSDQFHILYQNRYCDQKEFSIGVFGAENDRKNVLYNKPFLLNNFDTKVYLSSVLKRQFGCKAIASGSDIYLLDDYKVGISYSVMMYSPSTDNWKSLPSLKNLRRSYCVCVFMQKLFVVSGKHYSGLRETSYDRSCMFYDKRSDKWTSIAATLEGREDAACAVFEGKIILSGGIRGKSIESKVKVGRHLMYNVSVLKSVEAYDYYVNKWSSFPFMFSKRSNHTAVSISNKMFMIGGSSVKCEIFDSVTRKFTFINPLPNLVNLDTYLNRNKTVSVGYNIYFFIKEENNVVNVHSYDVKNNVTTHKATLYLENTESFSCTKVSMY